MEPDNYRAAQRENTSVLYHYMGPAAAPKVQQSTAGASSQSQAGTSYQQPAPSHKFDPQWQPHPSQWPRQMPPVSVWGSMESRYMQQAIPHLYNHPSNSPPSSMPAQDTSSLNLSRGLSSLPDTPGNQDTSFVTMLLGSSSQKTQQQQQAPQV